MWSYVIFIPVTFPLSQVNQPRITQLLLDYSVRANTRPQPQGMTTNTSFFFCRSSNHCDSGPILSHSETHRVAPHADVVEESEKATNPGSAACSPCEMWERPFGSYAPGHAITRTRQGSVGVGVGYSHRGSCK